MRGCDEYTGNFEQPCCLFWHVGGADSVPASMCEVQSLQDHDNISPVKFPVDLACHRRRRFLCVKTCNFIVVGTVFASWSLSLDDVKQRSALESSPSSTLYLSDATHRASNTHAKRTEDNAYAWTIFYCRAIALLTDVSMHQAA